MGHNFIPQANVRIETKKQGMFKSSLILFNISKSKNFGEIIRTGDALGISEILIVGRKQFTKYGHFGTYISHKMRHFYTLDSAVNYLHANGFKVVGIEICPESLSIEQHPFYGNTAFMPGNEGTGLSEKHKGFCDHMVYIKQFGQGASLNVNVATGIVLHHYSIWANYCENEINSQKFVHK